MVNIQTPTHHGVDIARIVGLACVLAWSNVAFFSKLVHYSTRNDISHLNSMYSFACLGMILAFMAVAALLRNEISGNRLLTTLDVDRGKSTGAFSIATALVLCTCTVVLIFVELDYFQQPWCSIASTVAGMALAGQWLLWTPRFAFRGNKKCVRDIILAFVVAACIFVIALCLPKELGTATAVLLPLASLACFLFFPAPETMEQKPLVTFPSVGSHIFTRSLICVLILSFAESFERSLFLQVNPISSTIVYRWLFLGSTLIAALVLVLSGLGNKSGTRPVKDLVRISMFCMGFLFLLAPIVRKLGMVADMSSLVCFCILSLLVWEMMAQCTLAYHMRVEVVFGFGLGIMFLGYLAGTFLGSVLLSFFDLSYEELSAVALACASLVFVSFLFVADEKTIIDVVGAEDERPVTPRRFMLRVEQLALEHKLSAKETEILILVAKGRSAQRIQEALDISKGTMNTHMTRIYRKLDIHDRQQLLDMLEETP